MQAVRLIVLAWLCIAGVLITTVSVSSHEVDKHSAASNLNQREQGDPDHEGVRLDSRRLASMFLLYLAGGVLLALVITDSWKQILASAMLGLVIFGLVLILLKPGPDWTALATRRDWWVLIFLLIVSAGLGAALVGSFRSAQASPGNWPAAMWSVPYVVLLSAQDEISPKRWKPAPDASLFLPNARADRLGLTYGALAGATVGALVADWHVVVEVVKDLQKPFGLSQVLFLVVLSAGFLVPLHEAVSARHEPGHHDTKPPVQREHAQVTK
jgi:hypothetical protein